jgi:hypothetical protein
LTRDVNIGPEFCDKVSEMLPAYLRAVAIEIDGRNLPDPAADPFAPSLLRQLLDDRHERALRQIGYAREARELQRAKHQVARDWCRILESRKHALQSERVQRTEPYPDLVSYEFSFRWRMARFRALLWLHFACGARARGIEERCQRLARILVAAARPPGAVVAIGT